MESAKALAGWERRNPKQRCQTFPNFPNFSRSWYVLVPEQGAVELYGRDPIVAESLAAGFSDDVLPSPRVSWRDRAEGTNAAYQILAPKPRLMVCCCSLKSLE